VATRTQSPPAPLGLAPTTQFVLGKGGVGTSTVAAALALAWRDAGYKTLLVELAGQSPASALLSKRDVGYEPVGLAPRLQAVRIDPIGALKEYARIKLKVGMVADRLVSNPVFSQFAEAAPGFGDLLLLGKIWKLSEQRDGHAPRWDAIVVDAPSTGHGLGMLGMAKVVYKMFPVGPAANEAREVDGFLHDSERCQMLLVTLPEELPVQETVELDAALAEDGLAVSALVVNRCTLPRITADERDRLLAANIDDPSVAAGIDVARRGIDRAINQHATAKQLDDVPRPRWLLPDIAVDTLRRTDMQDLARWLAPEGQRKLTDMWSGTSPAKPGAVTPT
jgi:anion-transporting  ArsA/GET3 family ATPase